MEMFSKSYLVYLYMSESYISILFYVLTWFLDFHTINECNLMNCMHTQNWQVVLMLKYQTLQK